MARSADPQLAKVFAEESGESSERTHALHLVRYSAVWVGEPVIAVAVGKEIAAGNLAVEILLEPGDRASLLHALQCMRDSLAEIVCQIRQGTAAIGTSIDAVAAENQELAWRTERQASALEESAASMQQLTQDVLQSQDFAEQARQLALVASTTGQQGSSMVGELVDVMGRIDASSARIVDIVSVIDGIAFQSNLLALNAAVEAARAGYRARICRGRHRSGSTGGARL